MSKSPFQKFVVSYGPGDLVFEEGQPGATMYIVQSGKIELFRSVDEQRHSLGVLEKGDFFGEMSILEGLPRGTSAAVLEESELIEINSLTFDRMIKGNIEIAIRLLRKLSIRLREAERRLVQTEGGSARGLHSAGNAAPAPSGANAHRVESGPRLELGGDGQAYSLRERETLIGRYDPVTELRPDIDLTDADLKRSVSRRHAKLIKSGEQYAVIEEVGALNGTFVDGTKLVTGQAHPISDGSELALGMVKLVFRV